MRHENSKKLYTYWNNLRGIRPAPDRREIEPSDIRELLGDTFILEINSAFRSVSFRLAGTRLCNAYGRELKGLGFLALWDEQDNLTIMNSIRQVHTENHACAISCVAQTLGNRFCEYEMLMLPLENGSSDEKRILGIASSISAENWLGNDPINSNRIKSVRFLNQEYVSDAPSMVTPFGKKNVSAISNSRQVGHLTVIQGGMDGTG
ncbi:MAG: PAS domain-containing protein [Rhizobiaceae bacterium]|nr:PAS domain-containing protein [Rhizobiaceae bacterium]